jgi:hypothetical protein
MGNSMVSLIELDCDDTEVSDLPPSIGRCTNLTRLRMSNCPLIWPLDNLVMQGPSSVLRYLAEREAADVHAPPEQLKRAEGGSPEKSIMITAHSVKGLSRYYNQLLKNSDSDFREKHDMAGKRNGL